jgi:hypothetical protein
MQGDSGVAPNVLRSGKQYRATLTLGMSTTSVIAAASVRVRATSTGWQPGGSITGQCF